ncbi:hypothetical protein D3C87_257980 [compost metagenome]
MSIIGIIVGLLLLSGFLLGVAFIIRRSSAQTDPVSHESPNTQPPDSPANSNKHQVLSNEERIRAMSAEKRRRSEGPRP